MKNKSVFVAKERLKSLLISDRIDCTPDTLEKIKQELYNTVSKYFKVSQEAFEINMNCKEIHITLTGEDL